MPYRLASNEAVPDGIRRIATEQLDKALAQLEALDPDSADTADEAIHDARKRFKKVRAVLRLVRDEIGESAYKRENVSLRDAGRELSDLRDAWVRVETLRSLRDRFDDQLYVRAFGSLESSLLDEHARLRDHVLGDGAMRVELIATVRNARTRIADWPVGTDGWSALEGGLRRVYERGRKRFAKAYDKPSVERFHDWRKRVKYLWYHQRILENVWPAVMDEVADEQHRLSDLLGEEHDLAMLRRALRAHAEDAEGNGVEMVRALAKERGEQLRREAKPLAERLYAESPSAFVDRMEAYWDTWRAETAGERS